MADIEDMILIGEDNTVYAVVGENDPRRELAEENKFPPYSECIYLDNAQWKIQIGDLYFNDKFYRPF